MYPPKNIFKTFKPNKPQNSRNASIKIVLPNAFYFVMINPTQVIKHTKANSSIHYPNY